MLDVLSRLCLFYFKHFELGRCMGSIRPQSGRRDNAPI